jgi:nitrogen regulatory protein PII
MIEAVVKPQRLDAIKAALAQLGILGVTAIEVKGFGRQKGHTERYRGSRIDVGFVPKVMLKIAVREQDYEAAINAVVSNARTGEIGDGKIFSYKLDQVIRVRTGEKDNDAI